MQPTYQDAILETDPRQKTDAKPSSNHTISNAKGNGGDSLRCPTELPEGKPSKSSAKKIRQRNATLKISTTIDKGGFSK